MFLRSFKSVIGLHLLLCNFLRGTCSLGLTNLDNFQLPVVHGRHLVTNRILMLLVTGVGVLLTRMPIASFWNECGNKLFVPDVA